MSKTKAPHVLIIGAGIVGAAISLALTDRGAMVTVMDEAGPHAGATGKSFAWITNQAFFRAKDPIPEDCARAYFDLHRLSLGEWRRLESRLGAELGVRWGGGLHWGSGSEAVKLKAELSRRQAWGSPSYRIDRDQLMSLIPAGVIDDFEFGFYAPDEGTVNPYAATVKLLDAAIQAGALLDAPRKATGLEPGAGGGAVVMTETGPVEADHVIIAGGRQTPDLAALVGINVPLIETVGHLAHLEPIEMFLDAMVHGPSVHVIQRHDGRVILGRHFTGAAVSDGERLDVDALVSDAVRLFPKLKGAKVEKVTTGRRILPLDGLPIIGRSASTPAVRAIATNAGISLGPVFAQLITTEILDGVDVELFKAYRPERFERAPA